MEKISPLIALQMLGFFRIYWANLPAICWVQQTLGFFTIYWVMWSSFPHWVNLEKGQNYLITIYWAICLNGSFAIYLISLFIICWVQQMPSFFAVYWVTWSQFTDYVNLKKTRNLLRKFNHNLLSHLPKELICSLPDWSITICWAHTGGEGQFTQWVRCEFFVGFETIRPAHTQRVSSERFQKVPTNSPNPNPVGHFWKVPTNLPSEVPSR